MKILITGASGMVGKNLVEGLKSTEHQVFAPSSREMNLLNFDQTVLFLKEAKPEMVINCAGKVGGIQANIANPVSFLVDNTDMNRNLIMAAKKCEIKKIVNLGSSCMYPREAKNPLTEDLVLKGELEPTNEGYAIAKIFAQRLCDYVSKENPEYQYKTLLPCNLYGPFDKFDPKHSHLLPAIIFKIDQAIKLNQKSVEIWGTGEARREFMYVGDLVECIKKAISEFDSLPSLMNVGLGHDYSVNEYYKTVAEVMGYKGEFTHDTSKPVGMKQKLVSIEKSKAWGWMSKTSLQAGIQSTVRYYKSLPEFKEP